MKEIVTNKKKEKKSTLMISLAVEANNMGAAISKAAYECNIEAEVQMNINGESGCTEDISRINDWSTDLLEGVVWQTKSYHGSHGLKHWLQLDFP